jgi:hypothetical protein
MCLLFRFSIQQFFRCPFYCQKWPLFVNFNIPHCERQFFSQCSTPLVGMRFCKLVPNSPMDKNKKLHNPCLLIYIFFK